MRNYTYRLQDDINKNLDLRPFADEISAAVKSFGGEKVRVYRRGYTFNWPKRKSFTNGQKRALGKKIAQIDGLGENAKTYDYTYRSGENEGEAGKSNQLFRIKE